MVIFDYPAVAIQFSTTVDSWENRWSWVIRHLSHSPFSHVDIEIPGEGLLGASDSPDAPVIRGNPRGVALRPPDYEDYGRKCRMIVQTMLAERIRAAALEQIGKPFDNGALEGFLSDAMPGERDWLAPDSFFCSELVAYAFHTAGYWGNPPSVWPKNRISPSDLLMIFLFDPNWTNRDTFWEDK